MVPSIGGAMRIYNRSSKLMVYTTDGNKAELADLSGLDFDFTVAAKAPYKKDKKNHTTPVMATVNVYRLSGSTRSKLTAEGAGVEIQAGYDDDTSPIFNGVIVNIDHNYIAPDWVTTIWASDGWAEYDQSFFSKSYASNTPVSSVVSDVASSFALPVVDRSAKAQTLLTGTVYDGKSKDIMDKLSRDYDLYWSISDGSINIEDSLNPPLVNRGRAIVLSDDLLDGPIIEETLEGNKPKNKKVVRRARALCLLNRGLFPGVPVQFKAKSFERQFSDVSNKELSDVDPDSYYICDEVTHRGSNWSVENSTEILTREENAE